MQNQKQTHQPHHSMGVHLRSQVAHPQHEKAQADAYSQSVTPQNQQHNTIDYSSSQQQHFRQPTLLSSIQQYQTISSESQPQHQLAYTSVPISNLTSIQQANNSRIITSPQTQTMQVEVPERDDEDSNPLLDVEVRDIVNNYLDDSLQSGDNIQSDNDEDIEIGEVEVVETNEHQAFQKTDELQEALFADMDEGDAAVDWHQMEAQVTQEENNGQFADQYCYPNQTQSNSSQQQIVLTMMQQSSTLHGNPGRSEFTLDARSNNRSKSDQKHEGSIIAQECAIQLSRQKLSSKQAKQKKLEVLLKRERQMESSRDFQKQRAAAARVPKQQTNSEDQKVRRTEFPQSTKNHDAHREMAFSQRGAMVMQSLDNSAQPMRYANECVKSDNKVDRRTAAPTNNQNVHIIQNGFQSYHQQQVNQQAAQQPTQHRYSKKQALETIRSHLESPLHGDGEDVGTIIQRLKKFSPTRIKQNLAETYKANQDDLRKVIRDLEDDREEKIKTEEFYKERIRLIQVQNIKNLQQKEHLMNQATEMARFFRFLHRCRKRMKRTLQLSKAYESDEMAGRRHGRGTHRCTSGRSRGHRGKHPKESGRVMSQAERTLTDNTTIMQSINTNSHSKERCRSGDARNDTLRSPTSYSKSTAAVVDDDGLIDFSKSVNDIKFQFRVLLDRIKLQTQINQKKLQEVNQVRVKEREQQKEFAQSVRQSDRQVLNEMRNQAQQDEAAINMKWELKFRRLQGEMHTVQDENQRLKQDLQHFSKLNFELEQSLERSESELDKLRMQAGAQARQIKTLLEHNPSSSDCNSDLNSMKNNMQENRGVPQKIAELTDYINNLESENEQQKQVIEAMELRAQKYRQVEDLQRDLDQLLQDNDRDKKKFQDNEKTLVRKIECLEGEIQRLQGKSNDDHEFFKMETLRKDQAIENMQHTFIMVLQRAVQKIAFMIDKNSRMTLPKIEGCLEEISRNFMVEISSIKTQFMGDQDSCVPVSPKGGSGLIHEIYSPATRLKPKTAKSQPRKDQKRKQETFIYTDPQTSQPLRRDSPKHKSIENQENANLRHQYAEQNAGGQTFTHKAMPNEFTANQGNHQFTKTNPASEYQKYNRTQSFGDTVDDIGFLRVASFSNTISEPQFEREESREADLQKYLN